MGLFSLSLLIVSLLLVLFYPSSSSLSSFSKFLFPPAFKPLYFSCFLFACLSLLCRYRPTSSSHNFVSFHVLKKISFFSLYLVPCLVPIFIPIFPYFTLLYFISILFFFLPPILLFSCLFLHFFFFTTSSSCCCCCFGVALMAEQVACVSAT